MVVHFPIALLIVGFAFASLTLVCKKCTKSDCSLDDNKPSCVQKVSYWLLSLGALSAVVAILTGLFFTNEMQGPLGTMRDTHALLAGATTITALIAAAVYTYYIYKAHTKPVLFIGYSLYVICTILVAITGHYGGEMVYMFK